jgi:hypothetical protein
VSSNKSSPSLTLCDDALTPEIFRQIRALNLLETFLISCAAVRLWMRSVKYHRQHPLLRCPQKRCGSLSPYAVARGALNTLTGSLAPPQRRRRANAVESVLVDGSFMPRLNGDLLR